MEREEKSINTFAYGFLKQLKVYFSHEFKA